MQRERSAPNPRDEPEHKIHIYILSLRQSDATPLIGMKSAHAARSVPSDAPRSLLRENSYK